MEINAKQTIKELRFSNPYHENVFIEPTKEEYEKMKKIFKDNGMSPDKFFGSFGRRVWNNCVDNVKEIFMRDDDSLEDEE